MNVMQTLADFKQQLHNQGTGNLGSGANQSHAAAASSGPLPADSGSTSSSGSDSTTITANDFLQLLVAEMKNQDPTADQDPNAYIDQLVQVNSLQQLISINQELGGASGSAAGSATRLHSATGLGSAAGTPAASISTSLARPAAETGQAPQGALGTFSAGIDPAAPGVPTITPPAAVSSLPAASAAAALRR